MSAAEPLTCMLFDENGNAVDSFDYTAAELASRVRLLGGLAPQHPDYAALHALHTGIDPGDAYPI